MSVEGQAGREKSEKSPPTLVEVSVALVVALLLVMTGIRLFGGFAVATNRGAHASATSDQADDSLTLTKASRTSH